MNDQACWFDIVLLIIRNTPSREVLVIKLYCFAQTRTFFGATRRVVFIDINFVRTHRLTDMQVKYVGTNIFSACDYKEAFRELRHLHVFDLVMWPWPFVKVKKADVIRCLFLYCTLVPGMGLILYEISPFVYFMWPLTFTCDLQLLSRSLAHWSLDVFNVVECLY